jgi:hypothetical protein
MTERLSFCLKAVTTLNDADLAAVTERIETYRAQGVQAGQSEQAAVDDLIAQVQAEQLELLGDLRQQHGDLFVRPPAADVAPPAEDRTAAVGYMSPTAAALAAKQAATEQEIAAELDRLNGQWQDLNRQQLEVPGIDSPERMALLQQMDAIDRRRAELVKLLPDETAAAEPEPGAMDDAPFAPAAGWRESMFHAREYAKHLGIERDGKDLAALVKAIDGKVGKPPKKRTAAQEPAAAPSVPKPVRDKVRIALGKLRSIEEQLAAVEKARGRGHVLALEYQDQAPKVLKAQATLAEFRRLAEGKGIDAEALIAELGGMPDLERFNVTPVVATPPALARSNLGAKVTPQVPPRGAKPDPLAAAAGDSDAVRQAKADLLDSLGDLGDILGKPGRATMMPEAEQRLLPVLTRVFDAAFRLGYLKFKDAARFVLDTIRSKLGDEVADQITLDHLQGAYIGMAGRYRDQGADRAAAVAAVESMDELQPDNAPEDDDHVPSTDASVERDRADADAEARPVDDLVQPGAGRAAEGTGGPGEPAFGPGGRQPNDSGLRAGGAAAAGERGDQQVPAGDRLAGAARGAAGADDDQRGGGLGDSGVQPDPIAGGAAAPAADRGLQEAAKRQQQRAADSIPVTPGDLANVRATLPYLLPEQQEDVHKAELRFAAADGFGMLFTNGTGTGKTFTGLGVVKRFERQGKTNVLIVVPSDKIAEDWITSGRALGLDITQLASTKDAGKGIVVTTYANLGQNDELARRPWDLVVPDEAHYLMQQADGALTTALASLRAITLHPDGAHTRAVMIHRELHQAASAASAEAELARKSDDEREWARAVKLEADAAKLWREFEAKADAIKADVANRQGPERTRAVFLSFTPFAYDKTIDWANGYLFDYAEGQSGQNLASGSGAGHGYNSGDWREQFFMTHLGYRMRYNKLTAPDAKVDQGLMRRQLNSWLKKRGALSGRMLNVDKDYDRRFVLVDSAIGHQIDGALEWLRDHTVPGRHALAELINERFDYLSRRYLLEAIKAEEAAPIVRQHMAMGRKVVVFHDYKKGGGFHPFSLEIAPDQKADAYVGGKYVSVPLAPIFAEFKAAFPELMAYPFASMRSPIETFTREFGKDLLLFNGDVPSKERRAAVARFQSDDTGPQVILVQSAAGKEGISLHDTTGKHQRVLINLGQPTQPTTAMQQEGRIYRTGQASDAIIRYLNTGTSWERWAFASTIAQRSSAAEDLGSGELARALKDSFIRAFEDSDAYPPGHEGEGTGGKEGDKAANAAITEYDRAKAFYFGTQKKTQATKAAEGTDYFATPEPIGLKMVEWLDARPGEAVLEPSAGHGAIARWFNDGLKRTAIEPSPKLSARLALTFDGEIKQQPFEDLHVVNKYDGIAMNPPFGTAGRTAVDHLAKAATHLRDGGRIVALLPTGPSADAKFDRWFYEESTKPSKPLYTHPELGEIHVGDMLTANQSMGGLRFYVGHVDKHRDGRITARPTGESIKSGVWLEWIVGVKPGKRTESYRPADGLQLVADIKLPHVTFERAGTQVATRIVVLEKSDAAPQQVSRDYTDAEDIGDLFDRLEDVGLQPRAKPVEEAPAPAETDSTSPRAVRETQRAEKAAARESGVQQAGASGMEVVEHITGKGKLLKGFVRKDLTQAQAKEIDAYTFKKDGGWFIRAEHLQALLKAHPPAQLSREGAPAELKRPGGIPVKLASAVADQLAASGIQINVAATVNDMPPSLKGALLARDPAGQAKGVYFPGGDEVWLIAGNLRSIDELVFVALHESFHRGLHITLGAEGAQLLRQLYAANARVRELADDQMRRFGIDLEEAVNEALADLAGSGEAETLNGWQKLVRLVREWVAKVARAVGVELQWSDARVLDLVAKLTRAGLNGEPAVNMPEVQAQPLAGRGDSAFARWFGASKIVDAQGNPRVMYHGTAQDITSFIPKQAGAIFVTPEPVFAEGYATASVDWMRRRGLAGAPNIMPMYVSAQRPFDFEDDAQRAQVIQLALQQNGARRPDGEIAIELEKGVPTLWTAEVIEEALVGPSGDGNWSVIEEPWMQDAIKAAGFDSFWVEEGGFKNLGVYKPSQLKSATGNAGTYDPEDDSILLNRGGQPKHTPEELAALAKAGQHPRRRLSQSVMAGWGAMTEAFGARGLIAEHLRQGGLDQFFGIQRAVQRDVGNLPVEQDPYVTARLANGGTSSVMRALLLHGQARWAANGQHLEKIPDTKGLLDILKPLGDDLPDFFGWMVGNRAARLMREGRENNLSAGQIKTLRGLAKTPEQLALFRATAKDYATFKRSVLDVAEQAGLIDPEGRAVWDQADYIPFYRQVDEKALFTATGRKGLAGQSSGIRTLRGGEAALNDPVENLLMNFSRLIDASLKNNALSRTVQVLEDGGSTAVHKVGYDMKPAIVPRSEVERALEEAGVPEDLMDLMPPEAFDGMARMWSIQAPQDPDVIRVMRGGKPQFYRVDDPLLLKAATSFVPFDFPGLGLARFFKRVLTGAVTATPEFMLRNWVRDSLAVQGITREWVNPLKSLTGIVDAYREDGAAETMLFAGASFQGGNIGGHDPSTTARAMRRALRQRGLDASAVDSFMGSLVDRPVRAWELYRKAGEAIENANREAVFEATMRAGRSTTAAAYEAKDLMDFSLRGSHPIYQLAADVLPFFNARVQGLYRLARSNPRRLAVYGGIMATLSVALVLANTGEDWYDELPDWDKDGFWHMRIGGAHFRIPKPFELGVAFATVPERIARFMADADSASKFGGRLWANMRDQLAFDPVPQMLRPAINVWANQDTFRDMPIENASDEGKLPHRRFSESTSATMRELTDGLEPLVDLSPKQLEYLVGGYLGTAGLYALGLSDMAVRQMGDYPDRPAMRLDDLPVVRAFYREDPARATVFEADLYRVREKVDQVYRSVMDAARKGDPATVEELMKRYPKELAARGQVTGAVRELSAYTRERDRIMRDRDMTPEQKRQAIDELQRERNAAAKRAATSEAVQALQ